MNEEITVISSGKGATGKVPSYVRKILEEKGSEVENTVEISAAEELLFGDEESQQEDLLNEFFCKKYG